MDSREEAGFHKGAEKSRAKRNGRGNKSVVKGKLVEELESLKRRVGMGYEVEVKWVPGAARFKNGKRLLEEVVGNCIIIYAKDKNEALKLVRHGLAEWILNQHSKPYRHLINTLISLFEELQYEKKEEIVEALIKLMEER